MFKKIIDVKSSVVPYTVSEAAFSETSEAEVNATQTPVAWGKRTELLLGGKTRSAFGKNSSAVEIYGE